MRNVADTIRQIGMTEVSLDVEVDAGITIREADWVGTTLKSVIAAHLPAFASALNRIRSEISALPEAPHVLERHHSH